MSPRGRFRACAILRATQPFQSLRLIFLQLRTILASPHPPIAAALFPALLRGTHGVAAPGERGREQGGVKQDEGGTMTFYPLFQIVVYSSLYM
jgi:hypothetical protein